MKINTPKQKKKRFILVVLIFIIVVAGGLLAYFAINNNDLSDGDNKNPSTEQNKDTEIGNDIGDEKNNDNEKPVNDPQNGTSDSSPKINGVITSANVSGNTLAIRTQIDELLSDGTCLLTLSNGANLVTKTSDIINSATTSSCYGFDIPTSELTKGLWQINITIKSGDRTGIIKGEVRL